MILETIYFSTVAMVGVLLQAITTSATVLPSQLNSRQQSGATFTNPVTWQDLPDLEVIRVGDVFYYTSSTFAFSPGAPVHKSYDLVNWTPVSHSVPTLLFGAEYNLPSPSSRAYVKGIWASTLQYRASKDTFIWLGCINGGKTYIFTSPGSGAAANGGEVRSWNWTQSSVINKCYYDAGMLVDEDDTLYVAYGNKAITVAQLSADGKTEVKSQQVYSASVTIEGSRMYKKSGFYYILPTKPATAEWVLRSKSPFGPYEQRVLVDSIDGPLSNAGRAHQGGLIETKDGKWYYMAFLDAYPGGRIPVLAPITWVDNWPQLVKDGSRWGTSYPMPVKTDKKVPPTTGTDRFEGTELSHEWEWNHNPDNTKWAMASGGGVVLQTATVTDDLFSARNTLTHRLLGPVSVATFAIDISQMRDGDRAGASLFRDKSAYIGVHKTGTSAQVVHVSGVDLNGSWQTSSKGTVSATGPTVSGSMLYLRIKADVTPAFGQNPVRKAQFSYSLDGASYTRLGGDYTLVNTWQFFTGYRYAAFNFATKALGGQVTVKSFSMENA